jgi:uncharacterized protein (DUF1501 family)
VHRLQRVPRPRAPRLLIRGAGFGIAALVPSWLPNVVLAQSSSSRDIIVSVFLSGGTDGMSLVVPFGDPDYYTGRPTIAIPRPDAAGRVSRRRRSTTSSDSHPAWRRCCRPTPTATCSSCMQPARSTRRARTSMQQRYIEVGKPQDLNLSTGWLGRHLATITPMRTTAPLRALDCQRLADHTRRRTQDAAHRHTLQLHDRSSATTAPRAPRSCPTTTPARLTRQRATPSTPRTRSRCSRRFNFTGYTTQNGAVYPNTGFGNALKSTAALIKADVGVEAIHAFLGGWDTHAQQGTLPTVDGGGMYTRMLELSSTLAAFYADVIQGTTANGVTVVIISEFGPQRARERRSRHRSRPRQRGVRDGQEDSRRTRAHERMAGTRARESRIGPGSARHARPPRPPRGDRAEPTGNSNLSTVFPDYTPKVWNITKP